MNENHIHHLIAYPTRAPSSNELWTIYPHRLNELTEEEAFYLTQIATESMDALAAALLEQVTLKPAQMKEQLAHSFIYAFDKGVEIVYKMKVDSEEPMDLDFDEMAERTGDEIPEYIQLKLTPAIPTILMVFDETFDFAEQEAAAALDVQELYKSILVGGMLFGVEFCLRQDIYDDKEQETFLGN